LDVTDRGDSNLKVDKKSKKQKESWSLYGV
jgi:hypothetical protein